jgi:uncharacterized membrane protein YidH (DUF202 family)
VPVALYFVTALAGLGGLLLGNVYDRAILDLPSPIPPIAFAFVLEALVAAWFGHRRFGRALTPDQRARVALTYTLVVGVLLAAGTALGWMPWSDRVLEHLGHLSSGAALATLFVLSLALAAVALARFLVLALVAPLVGKPSKEHHA